MMKKKGSLCASGVLLLLLPAEAVSGSERASEWVSEWVHGAKVDLNKTYHQERCERGAKWVVPEMKCANRNNTHTTHRQVSVLLLQFLSQTMAKRRANVPPLPPAPPSPDCSLIWPRASRCNAQHIHRRLWVRHILLTHRQSIGTSAASLLHQTPSSSHCFSINWYANTSFEVLISSSELG